VREYPSALPNEARSDEVSLRDLYLVIRRGLPVILGLAALAGILAFLSNSRREPVYAAESTVLVTPPPIQITGDDDLSFSPSNEVSFETYETLARSQLVLEDAVSRVEANISPNQLLGMGSISELIGPQRPDQIVPLSVIHRVRSGNPRLAANLADAWAQSTLEAVRESLFASLSPVDATTEREVARLQREVEAVEARLRTFEAQDNGAVLEARLSGLTRQIAEGRARLGELSREIAASEARQEALRDQLGGAPDTATTQNPEAALEVLAAQRELNEARRGEASVSVDAGSRPGRFGNELSGLAATLGEETTRSIQNALEEREAARRGEEQARAQRALQTTLTRYALQTDVPEGILPLLSRADLRTETVAADGLRAEQAVLGEELAAYREEAAEIQGQIAGLNQRRSRLERELESALTSYNTVAELQASVSYLTELAPTNARILSSASVPTRPVGPRRAFNTLLATLLGALAGLLFVFLRAAVRSPEPGARPSAVKG